MKVVLYQGRSVIQSTGGAEKVFCDLASGLAESGHDVHAICSERKVGLPFYELSPKVKFNNLYGHKAWMGWYRVYRFFQVTQPDIVICFFISDFIRAAALYPKARFVLMLHCEPQFYLKKLKSYRRIMFNAVKSRLLAVQVLLPSYVDAAKAIHENVVVIPNGVDLSKKWQAQPSKSTNIISIGRFETGKRQHLLIEAFAKIAEDFPEWTLSFWGSLDNKEYVDMCKLLAKKLGMSSERVKFCGVTKETKSVYEQAAIFVLPSAYEGFPLVLLEAMSASLPVIALEDCEAATHIVEPGINGLICQSQADQLGKSLRVLMVDPQSRSIMGSNGFDIAQKYNVSHVRESWVALITDLVSDNRQDSL